MVVDAVYFYFCLFVLVSGGQQEQCGNVLKTELPSSGCMPLSTRQVRVYIHVSLDSYIMGDETLSRGATAITETQYQGHPRTCGLQSFK